jgi:hypothetical protein
VLSDIAPNGLGSLADIAAGSMHSIALRSNGTVLAWGNNLLGQRNIPSGLAGVTAIAAGANHSLALRSNGVVIAWGHNVQGQCSVPAWLSNVVAVAAGAWHSLALRADGTVVAWGQSGVPASLGDVVAIAAGSGHSLALRGDGQVVAWGVAGFGSQFVPNYGQCDVPAALSNAVAVKAGDWNSLALQADGTVRAWGLNQYGQCNVPGDLGWTVAIASGLDHGLALVGNGAPRITVSPVGLHVFSGATISLHAKAAGAPPLSYQWQHNETDLDGATHASLTLSPARGGDTGRYRLRVQNAFGAAVSQTADLDVTPLPMISTIPDQIVPVDVSTGPLPFTVSHDTMPATQLRVSASANPSNLIGSLRLEGSGSQRTIEVIPAAGQWGASTITLTVSDDFFTVTNRFVVSIAPVPNLVPPPHQTIVQGSSTGPVPFTIGDPDSPLDQVTTVATADPPQMFSSVRTGGTGSLRTVELIAAPDRFGTASITLTVSDGTYTTTGRFLVTVLARPVLAQVPDQTILQGTAAGPIPLPIMDPDTPWPEWRITATSDHPLLVPQDNIHLSVSGGQYSLVITPASDYSGSAHITVAVSDGTASTSRSFVLHVRPRFDSPLLRLTGVEVPTNPPVRELRLQFADAGTGATNYALEYLPDWSGTYPWSNAPSVRIADLGGGRFQADVIPPAEDTGFYRLRGFQTLYANFSSAQMQADEGRGVAYLAVVFNGPFQGHVRYTVSGTAGTNDVETLSGVVAVDGNTASIPIRLRDDEDIGPLRYLTLTLEAAPAAGYRVGPIPTHTLTIEENDAAWQGQLQLDHALLDSVTSAIVHTNGNAASVTNSTAIPLQGYATIDFVLTLRQSGGSFRGALRSDQFGFFPTNDIPALITVAAGSFTARVNGIPLAPDSTFLGVPIRLDLQLTAETGQTNHTITPTQLAGDAEITMQFEGLPHLNATNSGRFFLLKPATMPGTNEVRLVSE